MGLSFLVWAVAVISLITAVVALVAYNDLNGSFLRSGPEKELQKALLRGGVGWSVLFAAACAGLGARLYQLNDNARPGEPRAIYRTTVAVAGFHLVVTGWALNGAWGNWMDVSDRPQGTGFRTRSGVEGGHTKGAARRRPPSGALEAGPAQEAGSAVRSAASRSAATWRRSGRNRPRAQCSSSALIRATTQP